MGLSKENNDEIMSDINITPLVDIMLVLLIIFMLVSSIVDMNGITVELPHAATGEDLRTRTVSVMISKSGDYYLNGEKITTAGELRHLLSLKKQENTNVQVIIAADKKTYHEEVVRVIDMVRTLNISRFAINVEYMEERNQP